MAYKTFSEKDLQDYRRKVQKGDLDVYDILFKEAKRVAKAANSRLLRIEKANKTAESQAYGLASVYTNGANRFRINKSLSFENLIDTIRQMRTFMSKESSTLRGLKYAQNRTIKTLESYGIKIEDNWKDDFYSFIRTDEFADMVDYIGEYDLLMDLISNNLEKKVDSINSLISQFNAFLSGDEYFDEFLDRLAKKGGLTYVDLQKRHSERERTKRKRSKRR